MMAVIMAGGEGSRLRPLTCDTPKPLARLCGRPTMEYLLDLLSQHHIKEAAVTVRYLKDQMIEAFPGAGYGELSLRFVEETEPLGTAGSVKNAVQDRYEDVLVISGDALCDIDLTQAIQQHKQLNADVTIVVTHVTDPREYGLVHFNEQKTITGFLEKPGWNQVSTDAANTGIYILSSRCLSLIPANKPFDFAKDLFPLMLQKGMKLTAYETQKYWCDIGDLTSYVSCQRDLLEQKVKVNYWPSENNIFHSGKLPDGDYKLIAPCFIGANVKIGKGSIIGPNAVLDDSVNVGEMARVRASIALPGAYIGAYARLTGAVVCSGASVKKGASLFEGAVLGAGAIAGEGAEILQNVKVWPKKRVEDGVRLQENLKYGASMPDLMNDDGISGEAGVEMTPEFCARLGAATGTLKCGSRIGVACTGGKAAKAFKSAFIAGALSTGAQVWDFGGIMQSQMSFAVLSCGLQVAAYLETGPTCSIKIIGEGGLPATRALERELFSHLARGEFKRCSWNDYRDVADMNGMQLIYQQELYSTAPEGLGGMNAQVRVFNRETGNLFEDTLSRLGCDTSSGPLFTLSPDGMQVSIRDELAGYLEPEMVFLLCCIIEFQRGNNVAVPYDAPRKVDVLAEKYGCKALRYLSYPADDSDREARRLTRMQLWVRDGIIASIMLLSYLKKSGRKLHELVEEVPKFATVVHTIPLSVPPSKVFSGIKDADVAREGVYIQREKGSLLLRPSKKGNMLKVLAEAADSEIAEELCTQITQTVNTLLDTDEGKG